MLKAIATLATLACIVSVASANDKDSPRPKPTDSPLSVGKFPQEVRTFYTEKDGLASNSVLCVGIGETGSIFAGTEQGLSYRSNGQWQTIRSTHNVPVTQLTVISIPEKKSEIVFFLANGVLHRWVPGSADLDPVAMSDSRSFPSSGAKVRLLSSKGHSLFIATDENLFELDVSADGKLAASDRSISIPLPGTLLSMAFGDSNEVFLGFDDALLVFDGESVRNLFPTQKPRRWAPSEVRGIAVTPSGNLWVACEQGAASRKDSWSLFEGRDGLPYNQLHCVAVGNNGDAWFGTPIGAIRKGGDQWYYRQGLRWLPGDEVRSIAVDSDNSAWIGTDGGLSHIRFEPMTLAEKADYYELEIDRYHRRTEHEYVLEVSVPVAGSKDDFLQSDSDNDGLWTAMYGVGECYAYGATKSDLSKQRAKKAFQALKFLLVAPEGSEHAPPSGFVARTVVPTTEPDPNERESYTLAGQERRRESRDSLWRVYEPRWPKSADGKYFWKSDTSSDELDGHYYFYPLYYDLVAETEEEKEEVREVVRKITDHLIEHDYFMEDHAGQTRWGVYSPEVLNKDPLWHAARGIKSLSILSYLNVAYHMTGDSKYRDEHVRLRDEHHYFLNTLWPEYQRGIGSGNHSDDEMFLMGFYNLIKYEPDQELRAWYLSALAQWWRIEEPEVNPYFNFTYAALAKDESLTTQWGTYDLSPWATWLDDSVETLKRFPLDRFSWGHRNSHRDDIVRLTEHMADPIDDPINGELGYRVNGKVLPVDERYFNHWNHNPWRLDYAGDGRVLGTGAVYTLSYNTGLYYGFIAKE